MATEQLNVRIPPEFRQLLKLLVYLEDCSEALVVCAGLLLNAKECLSIMAEDEAREPEELKLLEKAIARAQTPRTY